MVYLCFMIQTGIYTITNLINNKIYVGLSTNILQRIEYHKRSLRKNNHHCIYLQRAWDIYGEENFLFEILEECKEEYLYSEEHYWATLLNVHNRKHGYNEKPTDPLGKPRHSELTKQKIGLGNKNRIVSKETVIKCQNTKKINAKKNGYFIAPTSKYWEVMKNRKGYKATPESIKKRIEKTSIKVKQYSLEGIFIKEWDSMSEAEMFLINKTTGKISLCCNGKRPSAYKFVWRFINDQFNKYPYHPRGNKIGHYRGIKIINN